jgi:gliding motility-associated-like protein
MGDSINNVNWDFGDGATGTGSNLSHIYNKSGNYRVLMTANIGSNNPCSADTFTKLIKVFSRPYFSLGADTVICEGTYFVLSPFAPSKSKFSWSNGSTSRSYSGSNPETVWLTVSDSNLCKYSDTIRITQKDCDSTFLRIPNVFTPGHDGMNDLFEVEYTGLKKVEGKIFDRWGKEVYSFNHPEQEFWNGGNGNDLSRPCPSGTYYYVIYISEQDKRYSGVVTLLRE